MERQPTPDIDVSLLRVAVGYRVLAAVWLMILGAITLAGGQSRLDEPWVVGVTMSGAAVWTGVTLWLAISHPARLNSTLFLIADVAVAVGTLLSADAAGAESFSGGYPLSTVFLAIYARGTSAGLSAAAVLTVTALVRATNGETGDLTLVTGSVIVYVFSAVAASWAVALLRRNDVRTRLAEETVASERAARATAEARAEMASHIHDSVLQTLALIQRSAEDPGRIVSLARLQERDLRSWLYGGDTGHAPDGLRASLLNMASDVEHRAGIKVEVVAVGDVGPGAETDALVAAAREAVLNAAKHSGADTVDVFAEVAADGLSVYVRDRGSGFDPVQVGPDRRGISDSIVGRMTRAGGTATIRSEQGKGTEVTLEIPRELP